MSTASRCAEELALASVAAAQRDERTSRRQDASSPIVEVSVANETSHQIAESQLQAAVTAALRRGRRRRASVSVAVVDDPTIHRLNREFLDHDYPTDVLSFVLDDQPDRLVGEIVASADTAKRFAAQAGWGPADELMLYIIHGSLHLCGFDDRTPTEARVMRAAEVETLAAMGVTPSATDSRWRDALV